MTSGISSPLEGIAAERFMATVRALSNSSGTPTSDLDRRKILQDEIDWIRNTKSLKGDTLAYEASIRVLLDLIRLGWDIREEGFGIAYFAPKVPTQGLTPEEILQEKRRTRESFRPVLEAQLHSEPVVSFIRRMEAPAAKSKKEPVTCLIADGKEVHGRIIKAQKKTLPQLAVEPYLQLVESDKIDEFTGHSLRDVWRYFRFSWSVPQFPIPGRQLLYLVRDKAHPCNAIMGIIGLNNSPMQLGVARENHLRWNFDSLRQQLISKTSNELHDEWVWMSSQIDATLTEVDSTSLVSAKEIKSPSEAIIVRLKHEAERFSQLRNEALQASAEKEESEPANNDAEDGYAGPPVSEEMLNLEEKVTDRNLQRARKYLVSRKRASLLAKLLHAKMVLNLHKQSLTTPGEIASALGKESIQTTLNTVLRSLKSRYAGANMLEITTCGAIAPYNHLLSGKLASLLLFSPQVAADYRRLYRKPSIIASQIKNSRVQRSNELVYLGTSSLYIQGSSQYHRLRLPAGLISSDQPELCYKKIGQTSGYGTLQFSDETREAVEKNLEFKKRFSDVNSIFGEGPSPKLRKLVDGLKKLGFPPDSLMRHHRPRLLYSVCLCDEAIQFLNAKPCELPPYVQHPEKFTDATQKIVDYWQTRWFASRLKHQPSVITLSTTRPWKISDKLSTRASKKKAADKLGQPPGGASGMDTPKTIWHKLAASGPQTTSDSLSEKELQHLHVKHPIEDFMQERIEAKQSVFLTGNAGDGKTHLLKNLAHSLTKMEAVTIYDATAEMRNGDLSPILDKWKDAMCRKVPFFMAINEYPLHLLAEEATEHFPHLKEGIKQQRIKRLTYGPVTEEERITTSNFFVLDLSLRNPLHKDFSGACLRKILQDRELDRLATQDQNQTLVHNLQRLRDPDVQERVLQLFDKLATRGIHATVRELWVVLARLVLGYRADMGEPLGESSDYWYSENLFQKDDRFDIYQWFRELDPAYISHPVWDSRIEEQANSMNGGWKFTWPRTPVEKNLTRATFQKHKRAFYFEHANGNAVFSLNPDDADNFQKLLNKECDDDPEDKGELIEAINRAYCPISFSSIRDSLYLWHGHRFHEQPSKVFLADQKIPSGAFRLWKPRLPHYISSAIPNYQPDHIALCSQDNSHVRLVIDYHLYQTLSRLRSGGIPRKLLPDRDIFRVEAFIDQLYREAGNRERRIFSAHLGRRELLQIVVGSNGKLYEDINIES